MKILSFLEDNPGAFFIMSYDIKRKYGNRKIRLSKTQDNSIHDA
jgi:hypothetical protein